MTGVAEPPKELPADAVDRNLECTVQRSRNDSPRTRGTPDGQDDVEDTFDGSEERFPPRSPSRSGEDELRAPALEGLLARERQTSQVLQSNGDVTDLEVESDTAQIHQAAPPSIHNEGHGHTTIALVSGDEREEERLIVRRTALTPSSARLSSPTSQQPSSFVQGGEVISVDRYIDVEAIRTAILASAAAAIENYGVQPPGRLLSEVEGPATADAYQIGVEQTVTSLPVTITAIQEMRLERDTSICLQEVDEVRCLED